MRSRLKNVHKMIHVDEEQNMLQSTTKRQVTLHRYNQSRSNLTTEKRNAITSSLDLACALDIRPVHMVEGLGFKGFCSALNPDYHMPCGEMVTNHLLLLYKQNIEELINSRKCCCCNNRPVDRCELKKLYHNYSPPHQGLEIDDVRSSYQAI